VPFPESPTVTSSNARESAEATLIRAVTPPPTSSALPRKPGRHRPRLGVPGLSGKASAPPGRFPVTLRRAATSTVRRSSRPCACSEPPSSLCYLPWRAASVRRWRRLPKPTIAANLALLAASRVHHVARATSTECGSLSVSGDESEAALDALMARLAAGDRSAFEPLFRALHPRALRFARSRLAANADDVAQNALLNVFARATRFVPGKPALPWFYAIVANEIRAARRRALGGELTDEVSKQLSSERTHEDALLERELLQSLERAIDALDHASAAAIRAQLGRDVRPDMDPSTFRKRVSRAYARLRLLLGEPR
jgi:RNA polymerase sigma factor (sigma-70 family)